MQTILWQEVSEGSFAFVVDLQDVFVKTRAGWSKVVISQPIQLPGGINNNGEVNLIIFIICFRHILRTPKRFVRAGINLIEVHIFARAYFTSTREDGVLHAYPNNLGQIFFLKYALTAHKLYSCMSKKYACSVEQPCAEKIEHCFCSVLESKV